jgi:hypothetical protein|tara:strand:- start:1309 stop:1425 length:117 start_codon:yes stop_codon:yes gene_type:complete
MASKDKLTTFGEEENAHHVVKNLQHMRSQNKNGIKKNI